MVKRIDKLTPEQKAQMIPWADKWIEIGLRTGNADREKFEVAARRCYAHANIKWPDRVVWVDNPLVLCLAAPIAMHLLKSRAVSDAVSGVVNGAVGDAVDGAVSDAVNRAVRGAVSGAVRDAVGAAVGAAVGGAVRDAVGAAVNRAVRGAVSGAVRDAVGAAVGAAVGGAVRDAVGAAVNSAVRGVVSGDVGDAVGGAVRGAVSDAVRGAVRGAVSDAVKQNWSRYLGGQFWVGGWCWGNAFVTFFRDVCGLELEENIADAMDAYQQVNESACWWYPTTNFVMVCERPLSIHRELVNPAVPRGWSSHRLHNPLGPAVEFRGWSIYAIHGVRVPEHVVMRPETITVAEIEAEINAEVRRVMIDRYGPGKYVVDSGAVTVDRCPADHPVVGLRTAVLRRKEVAGDEPILMLDMLDSTPEPDGSVKRYQIRIDPNAYKGEAAKSVLAAMASTYRDDSGGLLFSKPSDYAPMVET